MIHKVNEAALQTFLRSSPGIAAEVNQLAQDVVDEAKGDVRKIMHRLPAVANSVDYTIDDQLRAVVGIRDFGDIGKKKKSAEQYLAQKEQKEGGAWLLPAMERVFT